MHRYRALALSAFLICLLAVSAAPITVSLPGPMSAADQRFEAQHPRIFETELIPSPEATMIRPRPLSALGAALISALLFLLYIHRRRTYILLWTFAWLLLGAALLILPRPDESGRAALITPGISQFLNIMSALLYWVSADSFRGRSVFRSRNLAIAAILLAWFSFSPLIWGITVILAPGYILSSSILGAAGISYLLVLRDTKLAGAGLIGLSFILIALSNVGVILGLPEVAADGHLALQILLLNTILYTFAALGMHLLVFEDMNYELRATNRRLEAVQDGLRQIASTDPLTGCRNRRFFDDVIRHELQRNRRFEIPLSLLFIDVDNLKAVNDSRGHDAGDRLLQHLAATLKEEVREADYAFRWGGDEFLILLSCSYEEALRKATSIKAAFQTALEATDLPATSLSVGCSEVKPDVSEILPLIEQADRRMYQDKLARDSVRS